MISISCTSEKGAESSTDPVGKLTNHTDCKNGVEILKNDIQNNQSCIEYNYNDNTLSIIHFNAGFNCCPGRLSADIKIRDNIITIIENEEGASCECNCLYDLDFEIRNLKKGIYKIVFIEPYWKYEHNKISFEIDLNKVTNNTYCVERLFYPWNIHE